MPDHPGIAKTVHRAPFTGPVDQLGLVVPDLEEAIKRWLGVGVGPWFTASGAILARCHYRGELSSPKVAAAYSQVGDVRLELVQPLDDEGSVYREFLAAGGDGLQTLSWLTDDLDRAREAAEAAGHRIVQQGSVLGSDFVHYELASAPAAPPIAAGSGDAAQAVTEAARAWDGRIAELRETSDHVLDTLREGAAGWDGHAEPVRHLLGPVAKSSFEVEQLAHRVMRWFERPLR